MRLPAKHKGVSLVELMIAMVLGLLIIGGVTAIFVAAAASFNVKRDLDRSQENLRFVVSYLVHEVRQATRIYREELDQAWAAIEVEPNGPSNQVIIVRYEVAVDGDAVHCDGRPAFAGDVLEKRFSVDLDGLLQCESATLSGNSFAPIVSAETVASGLRRIRVDEWIESPIRPDEYALCAYSEAGDRVNLLAPCDKLAEDYNAGLGLVGVRILVELEHLRDETLEFVTTVALRNAVLEWFTRPERWESL